MEARRGGVKRSKRWNQVLFESYRLVFAWQRYG